jgi:hypothetical protein
MGVESRISLSMSKPVEIAIVALLCGGICFGAAKQRKQQPAKADPAPAAPVQQAVVPSPPPTPENMPAKPPQVAMNNGLLSITAENSTLGDVLNGIRRATGASVDMPPMASAERVVVHIGPTEPRAALAQLLDGSKFDYIIVGSTENDSALAKVILTARSSGGTTGGAVAANHPAYQPPAQQYQPPPEPDESGSDDTSSNQPEPGPEVTMPPEPPAGGPMQPQTQTDQQQNQNGPKTPEQLLQELQQMRGQQGQPGLPPDRNPQPQ